MTFDKLFDLNTVLTELEIEELRELCYDIGNSAFPIDMFFNDIERNKSENYNKNQAYKDLWLVVLYFLENEKKIEALSIIKEKKVNVGLFLIGYKALDYQNYEEHLELGFQIIKQVSEKPLTQEEYDLLKEVLL